MDKANKPFADETARHLPVRVCICTTVGTCQILTNNFLGLAPRTISHRATRKPKLHRPAGGGGGGGEDGGRRAGAGKYRSVLQLLAAVAPAVRRREGGSISCVCEMRCMGV